MPPLPSFMEEFGQYLKLNGYKISKNQYSKQQRKTQTKKASFEGKCNYKEAVFFQILVIKTVLIYMEPFENICRNKMKLQTMTFWKNSCCLTFNERYKLYCGLVFQKLVWQYFDLTRSTSSKNTENQNLSPQILILLHSFYTKELYQRKYQI